MRLVLAGGGTGGHLFPALAIADEVMSQDDSVEILFIGARGGIEAKVLKSYDYPFELIGVEAIKNKSGLSKIRAFVRATMATLKSMALLRRFKPDAILGSGGYVSGPVVMAGKILGIKTAILEQNLIPGATNRHLGRFVDRIYLAFEEAGKSLPKEKIRVTGTPIRRTLLNAYREQKAIEKANKPFTVFVFGGSQGATAINAAFIDAVEYLSDIWPNLRVIHQSGPEGYTMASEAYERKGLKVELKSFIEDMGSAYAEADLVVCRAGATTIAEITALGIPSILIPYPFAAADHQRINAAALEAKGAAVMISQDTLTGSQLAGTIRAFYEDVKKLEKVRESVVGLGRPGAAKAIVDDYLSI